MVKRCRRYTDIRTSRAHNVCLLILCLSLFDHWHSRLILQLFHEVVFHVRGMPPEPLPTEHRVQIFRDPGFGDRMKLEMHQSQIGIGAIPALCLGTIGRIDWSGRRSRNSSTSCFILSLTSYYHHHNLQYCLDCYNFTLQIRLPTTVKHVHLMILECTHRSRGPYHTRDAHWSLRLLSQQSWP